MTARVSTKKEALRIAAKLNKDIDRLRSANERFKDTNERLDEINKFLLRSNKRLRRLSLKDSNTGLFNLRYLEDAIERELSYARRNDLPFSVMLMDIDYFKSINDAYGHQFGDLVLKHLAQRIKAIVRRHDTVIRFGGEEFIIITPRTNKITTVALGNRILEAINSCNLGDKERVISLKISIAVASYPEDGPIMEGMDLIFAADQVLQRVKEFGGNRVYCSDITGKRQPCPQIDTAADVKTIKTKVQRLTKRANQSVVEAVFAFAKSIGLKDRYSVKSVEKAVHYAEEIARELGLPRNKIELVRKAAALHDLGKVGINENILCKKAKLSHEEYEAIKKHPKIAAHIIKPIKFLSDVIPFVLHHHERWDGKGYPDGLKGEKIPIGARIIAVMDVYQSLTANRPYRKAYSKEEAMKIIERGSGVEYDPAVVTAFLAVLKRE